MPNESENKHPWPRNSLEGAQLIAQIMSGLVTGPTAMVFIKQDALGQGASSWPAS